MKLTHILLGEILHYEPKFEEQIDKLKRMGGQYVGSGNYGSVYKVGEKAVKVTTDEDELNHAELLEGKKTNNFVYIHSVERLDNKLGIIVMDFLLKKDHLDIPEEFIDELEAEAKRFGIDPNELDVRPDNFLISPKSGKLKMVDV